MKPLACMLAAAALLPALAQAQSAAPDDPETADAQPRSTEQGQTPLDEAFTPRDRAAWIRDTRRQAWKDTTFDVQARTFYLDRDKYDDSQSTAWALGGSAGFKTGYFRERFAFGATGYTSQRLYGPDDKDGTLLLKPGQEGYTVLGEAYGEFLINDDTRLKLGRFGIDTPYVNRNDARMTPNTFQALTVQGVYGGDDGAPQWKFGAGYFDKIKERNADTFVSMARDAGAPSWVDRGVYTLGANYTRDRLSAGAIYYHSNDIIGIFYTEAKYAFPLGDTAKLNLALQYSDQDSAGDNLLRGDEFSARQWGGKLELGYKGALFTTGYTRASGGTNMQNPWSGYPGYTSVQVEDFNRNGEGAWLLRAAYNVQSVKGLSFYALYVDGSDPDAPTEYAKDEYNLNAQWTMADGPLKGLMMRVRYAHVSQKGPQTSDLDDLRLLVYYDPPGL
ncbi:MULTISPECIES: OprD family outer membrane porin [unclassified Stenotrophomonas]|uniref:OprD family outer membrane porin n=1 Tax=unclassified Stenotrophomonas TaxID=196198 RepID=UPI003713349B